MNLVDRTRKILLQPKQEWEVIAGETYSVQEIYTKYVMILAAIPAIAGFIGGSIVGMSGFGVSYRVPIAAGVASLVITYVMGLAMVYVVALVLDALAPTFGAQKNFGDSLKVAAFSPTAAWIAGVFYIIPALGILAVLGGLYSLYLLYLGILVVKKPAGDKAIPYTVVLILVVIVLSVIIGAISALTIPSPVRGF